MKHLFIINPAAGGNKGRVPALVTGLTSFLETAALPYEIYVTSSPGDAASKIRAEAARSDGLRVYACGGDGTLNDCINGACGLHNVAVTHYPRGTGNDFIKTFGEDAKGFCDLERLVNGFTRPVDLIDVNGRKAISVCSVGVDARIGTDVHKYSGLPLVGGAAGYVVSLAVNILKGINTDMTVTAGDKSFSGRFTLACVCNGRYYGGGFNPVPEADPCDGLLDVLLIRETSLPAFLALVGKYAKGRYRELGRRAVRLTVRELEIASGEAFVINADGEALYGDRARITVIPGGANVIFPSGTRFFEGV
ncbi:MAG: YegS/Rv2252/BmrU family lipid kinase [Oscillospiraceae bacterium]|nr:YegS/Rv2252/BmrU family lipid kinase [Oscillospiraceae bacterium]